MADLDLMYAKFAGQGCRSEFPVFLWMYIKRQDMLTMTENRLKFESVHTYETTK